LVSGHAFLLSSSRDLCWSLLLTRADASTRGVRGRRSGRDIRKGFDTAGARSGRWLPGRGPLPLALLPPSFFCSLSLERCYTRR
jgi:hypothetical protein